MPVMPDTSPTNTSGEVATTANRPFARQAILDHTRAVFGYELFDRSTPISEHTASSDAQLLFNALSLAENDALAANKTIFINCTHDSLAGGHLDLVDPPRVVLEIPPLPISQIDQVHNRLPNLETLKRRGFRLAFDYSILTRSYENWLPLASFIKFDLSILKPDAIRSFVTLAQTKSQARLVAEKVETHQQYQHVSGLGVGLFQGYWFAEPAEVHGRRMRSSQANILQLIDLVRKQASTEALEDLLKRDPTLSFNLLRFINSAGFGVRAEVTSFKHAVMLLGLNRLFKWAVLLMTTAGDSETPSAIGTTAVVRGRLMELLATGILSPEDCDNAFVVGVFSLLDAMLGMRMSDALAAVNLPAVVNDALLSQDGPLAPYLELAQACESGNDAAFARSAAALGLSSSQINWAHLQALSWAESLSA
jgi:EAL and modified HD-GYP domain-containing signal transduction protein